MPDILIKNASWLITMDRERRIIRDGLLTIERGRIVDVGKTSELEHRQTSTQVVIDATSRLVLPGLIDGHVHNVQQLARGLADEVDTRSWRFERIYPFQAELTEEDAYISSLLCQLELIKAGTTCFYEPGSYHPDQVVRAMAQSGLRGIVARTALDLHESVHPQKVFRESTDEALERGEDTVKRFHGSLDGRVKGSFALRSLVDCSDALCRKTGELASRYGVMIQTHGDAGKESAEISKRLFGVTGVERLSKLGVLGSNVLMIHMGGISPKGFLMMKETSAKGVSCPVASAHHGGTTSPYLPEMLDLGIDICLGSDSAANGNFLDVVRAMNFAALSTKRDRQDPRVLLPEQLLEMATLGAAKAGNWVAEIGSLEVGKKADITIFSLDRPEWVPVYNPIANLVYCASGASADTVIVDGKILMENRVVKTLDEKGIMEEAQRRGHVIAEKTGLLDKALPLWPII